MNNECRNTGYNIQLSLFDSERHITNTSLKNYMSMLTQKYTKNYRTILGYLWLTLWNGHVNSFLQPTPATNGILLKLSPSTVNPATSLELTLRLARDIKHEEYLILPAQKLNGRLTCTLKKDDKPLRTWDMNAILDIPSGHNAYNMKMQITRVIPGQKDLKMCLEGNKIWTKEGVNGHLNVGMSESAEGKCTAEDTILDIRMTGTKSEEQKMQNHVYRDCDEVISSDAVHHQYLPCHLAHDTIRSYKYDIKTTSLPASAKNCMVRIVNYLRNQIVPVYMDVKESTEKLERNQVKMSILFPTEDRSTEIRIKSLEHTYEIFSGLNFDFLQPDTMHYSKIYQNLHILGLMRRCTVNRNSMRLRNEDVPLQMKNEWMMFVGNAAQNPEQAVFIKQVEGTNKIVSFVFFHRVLHNINFVSFTGLKDHVQIP